MATAASRLSSFWVKAAVVAVLAAAAAVVAIRSYTEDDASADRREAVREYIVSVNTTQQVFAVELEQVNEAYRTLTLSGRAHDDQAERVARAEEALRDLRERLAAIPAPAEARRLRSEVVELADLYVAMATEVATMVRYVALQAREGRALVAATEALEQGLRKASTGDAQRKVLTAYETQLLTLGRRLDAADAPDVLEPGRVRQVARLRRLAALSSQLGRALQEADADSANRIFARFAAETAKGGTTKADQAAVRAYNARLRAITEQRSAVEAERRRLSASS